MSPRARPRLLAAALLVLVASPACVHPGRVPPARLSAHPDVSLLPEEIAVADLVNEFRASRGYPALGIDPQLCRAARKHAKNMARRGRLAHVLDGGGPGNRAAREGFRGPVFENIAGGDSAAPRSFFDLWVGSDAHRENLLALRTGSLGVGFARAPAARRDYYTAMFGAPQQTLERR